MSSQSAARVLDCRGLTCPGPIAHLSVAIKTIENGALLELLADDPGSVPDMEAFQQQTGHVIVEQSEVGGVFRFLIQRTK